MRLKVIVDPFSLLFNLDLQSCEMGHESFSQKYVMAVTRFAIIVLQVCIDHHVISYLVKVELYKTCKLEHHFGEI